jgi:uncharacterized membrane protein
VARGVAFAALGAIIGTRGGYYFRKAAGEATGLPDPVLTVLEDATAVILVNAASPGD